uniref:Uncharacterized protein n=1 Tax=Lactuca sativa TaxID=4236 RepID=A0A9R1VI27_LACSA|nr:hypothetical protein LSAT_V11C500267160 [Lactuca sativa]
MVQVKIFHFFLKIFKIQTISDVKTTKTINKTKTSNNNISRYSNLTKHLGFQMKIKFILHGINFLKGFQKPNSNLLNPIISSSVMLKNVESDSSSDDPTPVRNEEETNEELQPVEREELALARAYVNVSKDN